MGIENEHEHDTIPMKYKLKVSRMFSFVTHYACLWQLPNLSWYYPKGKKHSRTPPLFFIRARSAWEMTESRVYIYIYSYSRLYDNFQIWQKTSQIIAIDTDIHGPGLVTTGCISSRVRWSCPDLFPFSECCTGWSKKEARRENSCATWIIRCRRINVTTWRVNLSSLLTFRTPQLTILFTLVLGF